MKTATRQALLNAIASKGHGEDPEAIVAMLRDLYREVRAGAALPHAVVRAALAALPFTAEWMRAESKIDKAFRAIGYNHYVAPEAADLTALLAASDYIGIVRFTMGSHERDLWAAAMTVHYGPVGTHSAWRNPDGTLTAEGRALPMIERRVEKAREMCAFLIGRIERREQQKAA